MNANWFPLADLNMFSTIIAYMFTLVDEKKVAVPLGDSGQDNVTFLQNYLQRMLKAGFPHLTEYVSFSFSVVFKHVILGYSASSSQIKITVQGMFQLDQDVSQFKEHLRDFLVQVKVRNSDNK